jgi:hypothetical protein
MSLPPEEKQELLFFLISETRAAGAELPAPREFTTEQIAAWIADDVADLRSFRAES